MATTKTTKKSSVKEEKKTVAKKTKASEAKVKPVKKEVATKVAKSKKTAVKAETKTIAKEVEKTAQPNEKKVAGKTAPKKKENKEVAKKTTKTEKTGEDQTGETEEKPKIVKIKAKKIRSHKYHAVRAKVDRTKSYDPTAAIELVKKLSYTKFAGTISAHLVVKEVGVSKEITFPHSTGQTKKIEVASDQTIEKIEAGNLDFDILVASPQFMGKLTKYAAILGPKGLMPNPKNGTLTPNPEEKAKLLQAGAMTVRTEKKAPLIHLVIGKTDMETKQLAENLQVLTQAFNQTLVKVTIAATMSPGVKVMIEEVE